MLLYITVGTVKMLCKSIILTLCVCGGGGGTILASQTLFCGEIPMQQ
jgi:hypothetical protein